MRALVPPMLVAALAALAAGCAQTGTPAGAGGGGTVVRVVDGDTLTALIDGRREEVRLLGIDTPEVHRPDTPVQCYGPQASARTRALLPPDTSIRVVTDPSQDRRDRYGRLLAYVYPAGGARSINLRLLAEGYARLYVFDPRRPFRQVAAFRTAEAAARTADRGLWSACVGPGSGTAPSGPLAGGRDCPASRPVKGNLPSRVYHLPGDPDYAQTRPERCFATAADASRDGFRPSRAG